MRPTAYLGIILLTFTACDSRKSAGKPEPAIRPEPAAESKTAAKPEPAAKPETAAKIENPRFKTE